MTLVLASGSAARARMLRDVGLAVETLAPQVDEVAIREAMAADGADARTIADALAEAKAVKVSLRLGEADGHGVLVLGGDQTLALDDGTLLDKPVDADDAKRQLARLSGRTHRLFSAAVVAHAGRPVWRHVGTARLGVRQLGEGFIDAYVTAHWDLIRHCVGCYRIEAEGAQLFDRVEGDPWTIQGLPLLPLLGWLRARGVVPS